MLMTNRNKLGATVIVFVVLAIFMFSFFNFFLDTMDGLDTKLVLGDGVFRAGLALDQNARTHGLSTAGNMKVDQALLMAFPTDGNWGIWMKQMNFPIDIVWLNKDKQVVYLVPDVLPDSYPATFFPPMPTRYVIELPAGTISKKSIVTGQRATFQINEGDIK